MTGMMMDDEEEEALFARLRRGLEQVRRDAGAAQPDRFAGPPDPEALAALARVEASLRTLASNMESLARRADSLDAAIETRIETTVARATAGMKSEIERLSSRVAGLAARSEPARRAPAVGVAAPGSRRRTGGRFAVGLLVLVLLAAGAFAAWRGLGVDASPFGQRVLGRWAAWRALVWQDPATPAAAKAATDVPKPAVVEAAPAPSMAAPASAPKADPVAP
ncbi:MAG: hypothetical protein ABI369_09110, partial [Acetobacteraceae bacterium]